MHDSYKALLLKQYEASLCMLRACIDQCPEKLWNEPVANLKFCQVAFHTLFFTDVYLDNNLESVFQQEFHQANSEKFSDYEELEHRIQRLLYEKPFIQAYLIHCLDKARSIVPAETEETLNRPCEFDWKNLSRLELHFSSIRHLQHHTAQLSLRLRIDSSIDIPWFSSGWHELSPSLDHQQCENNENRR